MNKEICKRVKEVFSVEKNQVIAIYKKLHRKLKQIEILIKARIIITIFTSDYTVFNLMAVSKLVES